MGEKPNFDWKDADEVIRVARGIQPLSLASLRTRVIDALAPGAWKMPDVNALAQLWLVCRFIQSAMITSREHSAVARHMNDARNGLKSFLASARSLRQIAEASRVDTGDLLDLGTIVRDAEAANSRKNDFLYRLTEMERTVTGLVENPLLLLDQPVDLYKVMHWNDYVLLLYREFVEAVKSETENKAKIGSSEQGPAVAFIFGIIPELTGEDPKSKGNVSTQIKTRREPDRFLVTLLEAGGLIKPLGKTR